MKKATLKALVNYLNGAHITNLDDIKAELNSELAKNEAKAQANREHYALAHDVVLNAITQEPQTITEIYEACADELPEGFSKAKVQYAILNYWNDEIVKVTSAKGANQYRKM